MKLNNKGYMLVEVIVASALALTIAYYLINLTYKFKNTSSDIYQTYNYTNDKILITQNIMSDLEKKYIISLVSSANLIQFNIYDENDINHNKKRNLELIKGNTVIIKYGEVDESGNFDTNDVSYYEKELEPSLIVGDIELIYGDKNVAINIPITGMYNNSDYSIKLHAKTYNILNN